MDFLARLRRLIIISTRSFYPRLTRTSATIGHANIGTTMNIYVHFLKSAVEVAADKLDHLFNGSEKTEVQK